MTYTSNRYYCRGLYDTSSGTFSLPLSVDSKSFKKGDRTNLDNILVRDTGIRTELCNTTSLQDSVVGSWLPLSRNWCSGDSSSVTGSIGLSVVGVWNFDKISSDQLTCQLLGYEILIKLLLLLHQNLLTTK